MTDKRPMTDAELEEVFRSREDSQTPPSRTPDHAGFFHDQARRGFSMFKHQHLVWLAQWAMEFCEDNDIDPTQISLEDLTHG